MRFRLIVALLLAVVPASGWGGTGHRVIARIAENHLSPEAARAVQDLLGDDSLADISNWADEVRTTDEWRHTAPWHYVNFPRDTHDYESLTKNPNGDLVTGSRWSEEVLRDPASSREDRIVALKFLVHLIADMHQPFHAGRPEDRGGNEVHVLWMGQVTDLHTIWDKYLIDEENLSPPEWVQLLDHPANGQILEWQAGDFVDWVEETRELVDDCYGFEQGATLGNEYSDKYLPVVKQQLLKAGIRLAGKLNSIFGTD